MREVQDGVAQIRHIAIDDLAEQSRGFDYVVEDQMRLSDEERARQGRLSVLAERERGREFHVFLSYNSRDARDARVLAQKLRGEGLLPWLDEHDLLAGAQVVPALDEALERAPAAALLIGPHALGPWQKQEYYSLLARHVEQRDSRRVTIIPILLPGALDLTEMPSLLKGFSMVDFRGASGFDDRSVMQRLVRSIVEAAAR